MSQAFPVNADPRFRRITTTAGQSLLSIPFPFLADDDIAIEKITVNGTRSTLTRGLHYTLGGRGNPAGGSATLKPLFLARLNETYIVRGAAILTRANSVTRGGRYSSTQLDEDLDRLTLIAQEQARDLARSVKADFGEAAPELTVGSAGQILKFGANGSIVPGPDVAALEAVEVALGVEAGRALLHGAGGSDPYAAGGRRLAGVADGVDADDAVTKAQLDAVVGDIDPEGLAERIAALETTVAALIVPGDIIITTRKYTVDRPNWLLLTTTRTIGATGSGADVAGDHVEACYLAVWTDYSNDDCPVYTAAGAPTTRGVSAAADYAAGRRLTLPSPAGRFPRLASSGLLAGTKQPNTIKSHAHGASFAGAPHKHLIFGRDDTDSPAGNIVATKDNSGFNVNSETMETTAGGTVTVNSFGDEETRPDSFVFTALIYLGAGA